MILRYRKTRPESTTPRRTHVDDAGLDLAPTEHINLEPGRTAKLGTGLAFAIPPGHFGLVVPRSSTRARGLDMTGILDCQYRGEVFMCVTNIGREWQQIDAGAYLGQLLVIPCATPSLELVTELDETARSDSGFGSSDVKP